MRNETFRVDIIDMLSYNAGYAAGYADGKTDGVEYGYNACVLQRSPRRRYDTATRERQLYFMRQRILGVLSVLVAILAYLLIPDGGTLIAVAAGMPGMCLIFTRRMVLVDDYWHKCMEKIDRNRQHF